MAVWTDPDELEVVAGVSRGRAAQWNDVLENLRFLYDPPTVTVRLTAAQEVANASDHTVQWDEAAWDTSDTGFWDVGTKGSIVIPRSGVYLIVAGHLWEGTTSDNSKRSLRVVKNGGAAASDELGGDDRLSTSSPQGTLSIITNIAATDYLEFVARQLSGQALGLQPLRTRATVTFLRPAIV